MLGYQRKMKYYEDFEVGAVTVDPGRYTLTEDNIIAMGKEWDPHPFHTDSNAAKETFYGRLVASTVHLFAISVKLTHTAVEAPAAVGSLGTSDMTNHAPAYVGDTIENHSTILEKRISKSKPGLGIIKAQAQLINQDGKLLFSYVNTALYKLRAA